MKQAIWLLLLCAFGVGMAAREIRITDDGGLTIAVDDALPIRLCAWFGDWQWAVFSGEKVGDEFVGRLGPRDAADFVAAAYRIVEYDTGAAIRFRLRKVGNPVLRRGVLLRFGIPDGSARNRAAFSHGLPVYVGTDFGRAAGWCAFNIGGNRSVRISADRPTLFSGHVWERKSGLLVRLLGPDEAACEINLEIRIGDAITIEDQRDLSAGHGRSEIANAEFPEIVDQFAPFEIRVDLAGAWENPFDPDDARLDAIFTRPDGSTETVPGFFTHDFVHELAGDLELVEKTGAYGWRVRYNPRTAGTYSFCLEFTDRNGRARSKNFEFAVRHADADGFLRIGERTGDTAPRYFVNARDETVFLIGHNIPTWSPPADEAFARIRRAGGNCNRLWMCSQSLGIEWGDSIGYYRLDEAWRLDRALQSAERRGIYQVLCLDTHQDFRERFDANPYHRSRGGPCEKPLDFFTDTVARTAYRNRLRYVIARCWASPRVAAWELVNEAEGWEGAEENRAAVVRWTEEMAHTIKKLDPVGRPVSISLWTTAGWPELWNSAAVDFVQSHYYANTRVDMAQAVARISRDKARAYPGRLHLFAEYGLDARGGQSRLDPGGIHLHNGCWAALMSGAASVPFAWWHETYVDRHGLYGIYRGIAGFMRDERDFWRNAWRPVDDYAFEYADPPVEKKYRAVVFSGGADNWKKAEVVRFDIPRDGIGGEIGGLQKLLHGTTHEGLRTSQTFTVDYPMAGRFIVHVGKVGQDGRLRIFIDGKEVRTIELPTGEGRGKKSVFVERWGRWETDYDEEYVIDVAAGRHEISLENTGEDWITIERITLTNYRPDDVPDALFFGMRTGERVIGWIRNGAYTWYGAGTAVPVLPESRLAIGGLADGVYAVDFYDTVTGEKTKRVLVAGRGGQVAIPLPVIRRDTAFKLGREN